MQKEAIIRPQPKALAYTFKISIPETVKDAIKSAIIIGATYAIMNYILPDHIQLNLTMGITTLPFYFATEKAVACYRNLALLRRQNGHLKEIPLVPRVPRIGFAMSKSDQEFLKRLWINPGLMKDPYSNRFQ